jgi:hypothetical protein
MTVAGSSQAPILARRFLVVERLLIKVPRFWREELCLAKHRQGSRIPLEGRLV